MDHLGQTSEKRLQELVLDHRTILNIGTSGITPSPRNLALVRDVGIREPKVFTMLCLWYLFSGTTLFLNKLVLNALGGGAGLLGIAQVLVSTGCSFIQLYYPCGMWTAVKQPKPSNFRRNMVLVGVFRFFTIWFGLIALDYVAVSFAETIKCSAPLFTVIISRFVTGEPATLPIVLSLIPVMTGLALCCAHELSFNLWGFLASVITNISECFQSVFSKLLVSGEKHQCSPAELQFYSGSASLVLILPCLYFIPLEGMLDSLTFVTFWMIIVNAVSFHFQSITANVLMGFLSPTTYSVSNTVKRGLLIWCSILVFGNQVTMGAWFGTGLMLIGILLYNRAKTALVIAVSTAS